MNYWPTWSDLIFFVGYALALKYFDKAMTWTRWVASVAFVYAALLVARNYAPPLPDWGLGIFLTVLVLAICVWAIKTAREFR